MSEPRIGMSFGTYQLAEKRAKETLGNHRTLNTRSTTFDIYTAANGQKWEERFSRWDLGNGKVSFGHHINPGPYDNKGKCNLSYTGICHKDAVVYPFTKIIGEKTYAKDLNHNGIVDEGEIFEK